MWERALSRDLSTPDLLVDGDAVVFAQSECVAQSLQEAAFRFGIEIDRECRRGIGLARGFQLVDTQRERRFDVAVGKDTAPVIGPVAADTIQQASKYLENKSVGEVVSDVEDFARREPLIFLGGTFAVGLLLGRFLKASAPDDRGRTERARYDAPPPPRRTPSP